MRLLFLLISLSILPTFGQTNDTIPRVLNEVIITSYKDEPAKFSPLIISSIKLDSTTTTNQFNLCDVLKQTDGVTMLSTGIGISKPVIRGLYGNRILVLLNGLKFDNQQWQDEHGLGLTGFGLSRVELIKGPIGILYGTEAIGGVINLIEEERLIKNTSQCDYSLSFNSNTLGGMIQAGYKQSNEKTWWRIRIGADNHADYSDGNNNRVLNSRFDGYYLKGTYGFERKNWVSTNNFSTSFNRFGFIFNDIYTFVTPDNRWSRNLNDNPAHFVFLNILSSENKFSLNENLKLNVNIGIQSNQRMEKEGGGAISLNMHLLTIQNLAKLEYQIDNKNKLIFSNLNSFEDNTNYGARKIIPDANLQESNVSVNYEHNINNKLIFENGIGVGEKSIKTYFTASVNGQGKEVQPFDKFSLYYNLFSGISYLPNEHFNFKANLATGVRVANLAELSSNGLHEGIFTYEIGNPELKNEQVYSANFFANYENKFLEFSISPFYNYFDNYIYLAPVDEEFFGYPVYRYKQQNATQFGTEVALTFKTKQNLDFKISYSGMSSKTQDGNYTPFLPAHKITPSLSYKFLLKNKFQTNCFTNVEHNFDQYHTAPNEIGAPHYSVWNAGISTNIKAKHSNYKIGLGVNNILNATYYDNLSRFKNYGLLNIGRNILLDFKINL